MRLAEFIRGNIEPILAEWEVFARRIWQGVPADPATLRDHAATILRATAQDMMSAQTPEEQSDKSKGAGPIGITSVGISHGSIQHGVDRLRSGMNLLTVVSEYRALRASVTRLWRESRPRPDLNDLDDLTRFNESIDQSLAEAAASFVENGERSQQMFLAILGHDLRNPLNSIMLSGQVLSMAKGLDADASSAAKQITVSVQAMSQIIADLLDFTSTQLSGAMPVSPSAMDLGHLCQEVVDEIQTGHPTRTIRLQTRGDLTLDADAARLRQVISNLLGNAIQHGAAAHPIEVSVQGDGPMVQMAVRNEGHPIPRDALEAIFDPLIRGPSREAPGQRRPGSIGLGLYIAREIVTAHGGTIDVKSSAEAGTTFTVHLPRRRSKH